MKWKQRCSWMLGLDGMDEDELDESVTGEMGWVSEASIGGSNKSVGLMVGVTRLPRPLQRWIPFREDRGELLLRMLSLPENEPRE